MSTESLEFNQGFVAGLLASLHMLMLHSSETDARDIINSHASIDELEKYALSYGTGTDEQVIKWLKEIVFNKDL